MSTWILACQQLDPVNCTGENAGWIDYYSFDPLQITSGDVLNVYSWGFGVILSMWALGYAVSAAVSLIKKL